MIWFNDGPIEYDRILTAHHGTTLGLHWRILKDLLCFLQYPYEWAWDLNYSDVLLGAQVLRSHLQNQLLLQRRRDRRHRPRSHHCQGQSLRVKLMCVYRTYHLNVFAMMCLNWARTEHMLVATALFQFCSETWWLIHWKWTSFSGLFLKTLHIEII